MVGAGRDDGLRALEHVGRGFAEYVSQGHGAPAYRFAVHLPHVPNPKPLPTTRKAQEGDFRVELSPCGSDVEDAARASAIFLLFVPFVRDDRAEREFVLGQIHGKPLDEQVEKWW